MERSGVCGREAGAGRGRGGGDGRGGFRGAGRLAVEQAAQIDGRGPGIHPFAPQQVFGSQPARFGQLLQLAGRDRAVLLIIVGVIPLNFGHRMFSPLATGCATATSPTDTEGTYFNVPCISAHPRPTGKAAHAQFARVCSSGFLRQGAVAVLGMPQHLHHLGPEKQHDAQAVDPEHDGDE